MKAVIFVFYKTMKILLSLCLILLQIGIVSAQISTLHTLQTPMSEVNLLLKISATVNDINQQADIDLCIYGRYHRVRV